MGPSSNPSPSFGFNREAGASAQCSLDQGSASFGPCSGASSHSPSSPLSDGSYSFRVTATDAAGNSATATRSFSVDTQAPAAPQITATDPASPATDTNPEVKGTASADTASVEVFTEADCQGTPTSGSKDGFEGAGITVSVGQDQTTQLSARATDAAGNDSACSNNFSYTVPGPALTSPVPPLSPPLELDVEAKRKQKPSKLAVQVTCPKEPCSVTAAGRARGLRFALEQAASLAAGQPERLRLRATNRHRLARLVRRLEAGDVKRPLIARIEITATGLDGDKATELVEVRLKG